MCCCPWARAFLRYCLEFYFLLLRSFLSGRCHSCKLEGLESRKERGDRRRGHVLLSAGASLPALLS